MSGRPYCISIPRAKMATLIVATRALASRTVVSRKAVERLIGQWSWAMMLRRCALSILGETYRW
eukprot:15750999-Heterocapsa_arctica.AAC.1